MKKVWGGAFFGVNGKLVTHGGAGYKCTKRLPAVRDKTLQEITGGKIYEHKYETVKGSNVALPQYAIYTSRLKKNVRPAKRRGVEAQFTQVKMFVDDGK